MNNLIVTTHWLTEHLQDENLRVVDIRGHVLPASEPPPHYFSHRDAYEAEHIPGAVFVDWTKDIVEPESPSYDVANPQRYAQFMSQLGIGNNTHVVVYDDAQSMFAARFWWTLNYYGHDKVAILDGGWQKWLAEGHPTTADIPEIPETTFTPQINPRIHATREEIQHGKPQLLDVRSSQEFSGETSRAQRKGHIPKAVNAPRKSLVTDEGMMKTPHELRKIFSDLNITDESLDVVVYCNSGVSASYGLLALKVAGIDTGRVYDSSWKEWGNNPDTQIE